MSAAANSISRRRNSSACTRRTSTGSAPTSTGTASSRSRGPGISAASTKLIPLAKQANVSILPILDYDVPWATPAWRHPDAWGGYVRRIVSRYAKDLRYWEVWNEQNGSGFWRDRPSGANYVPLLKRAYEEIKKIDPELTVLYGGTAGVPLGYIEDSLKAGAGAYFDVMNIHPYTAGSAER